MVSTPVHRVPPEKSPSAPITAVVTRAMVPLFFCSAPLIAASVAKSKGKLSKPAAFTIFAPLFSANVEYSSTIFAIHGNSPEMSAKCTPCLAQAATSSEPCSLKGPAVLMTTLVRATNALMASVSVLPATMTGTPSRPKASSFFCDRPAIAQDLFPWTISGCFARYFATNLPVKPVAPYNTTSNSAAVLMYAGISRNFASEVLSHVAGGGDIFDRRVPGAGNNIKTIAKIGTRHGKIPHISIVLRKDSAKSTHKCL
mmetsp:Transcript_354/g.1126  ORF Transcript_354/g.1126 Transcript_354/m.1126 type:complete len:256 (-) Transcript_354:16-783(-)